MTDKPPIFNLEGIMGFNTKFKYNLLYSDDDIDLILLNVRSNFEFINTDNISISQLEYINSFHRQEDRNKRLISRCFLYEYISYLYKINNIVFNFTNKQRLFCDDSKMDFNISYSHDMMAVAISKNKKIGVDIELKKYDIVLDELVVKKITFPKAVSDSIDEKIRQKQIALSYEYKIEAEQQEAKRKKIEAEGIQSFQSIVSEGISENYLKWKGIDATLKLANSNNSKVVVIGSSKNGLPIILNTDSSERTQDKIVTKHSNQVKKEK